MASLSAKKPKKAKVRKTVTNDETCLHLHAFQWVQKAYPQLLIFHVANERKTAVQHHVKLKRMGVLKGVADFLMFPRVSKPAAIELKDDEGDQEDEQILFQRRWEAAGNPYFLVRTLAEFQGVVSGLMLFG